MPRSRTHLSPGPLHRCFAMVCAALVLGLGVLSASPQLHEQLHHRASGDNADQGCAVDLFAGGVPLALGCTAAVAQPLEWSEPTPRCVEEIRPDAPRYLHLPGRGPPVR
jgi:hypothetical protein